MKQLDKHYSVLAEIESLAQNKGVYLSGEHLLTAMNKPFFSPYTTLSYFPQFLKKIQSRVSENLSIRFGWTEVGWHVDGNLKRFFIVCGFEKYGQNKNRPDLFNCEIFSFVEKEIDLSKKIDIEYMYYDLHDVFRAHEDNYIAEQVNSKRVGWGCFNFNRKKERYGFGLVSPSFGGILISELLKNLKGLRWYDPLPRDYELFTFDEKGNMAVALSKTGWIMLGCSSDNYFHPFVTDKAIEESSSQLIKVLSDHKYGRVKTVGTDNDGITWTERDELELERLNFALENYSSWEIASEINPLWQSYRTEDSKSRNNVLNALDDNKNGILDIAESADFERLLKAKQSEILKFDKVEGNQFLRDYARLSSFLKKKANALQELYSVCLEDDNEISTKEREARFSAFQEAVLTYELQLYSGMTMIAALVEDDRLTFYEIHDAFDELGLFNSKWQSEMLETMKNLNENLSSVLVSINNLEIEMSRQLSNLSWIMENSTENLSSCLKEIDSSIQTTNLLQTIQVFQNYKRNKRLRK